MWPKALAQLIELAPHAARLLPMADKFFQSKTAVDDSSKRALDAMAEGLRGDLGQVTAAHAGLYAQLIGQQDLLAAQNEKLTDIALEVRASRAAIESTEARITGLERRLDKIAGLLILITIFCIALIVLAAILLYRAH